MADKYTCERCGKGFPTKQHYGSHIGAFKRFGTGCEPEEPRKKRKNRSQILPGVREAREANGWSRMDLAKRAKISENTVARVERGVAAWPKSLKAIAEVLGLPLKPSRPQRSRKSQKSKKSKAPTKLPVPIEVTKGGKNPDDILEIPVRIKIFVSVERI
jgi:transcriptional regulator with XRE-family HTH domain